MRDEERMKSRKVEEKGGKGRATFSEGEYERLANVCKG